MAYKAIKNQMIKGIHGIFLGTSIRNVRMFVKPKTLYNEKQDLVLLSVSKINIYMYTGT